MNRVKSVLSSFMSEQRHKRLRSAAAVTMAASVLFGVYGSMIRPAESFANSRASPAVYYDDEPEEIARVLNAGAPLPISRTDDASKTGLTQVTADVTGKLLDQSSNITKYTVDLTVDFHIASTDVAALGAHDNSICFDLDFEKDKNIKAIIDEQTQTELTGNVVSSDPSYSGSIGTYRLDVTTGVVTIQFDMTCTYFVERQGQDIGGGYTFRAYVWNDDSSDEDRTVNIAGYDVVVPIHRYANPSTLTVEKSYNNDFFKPTWGETMQNRKSLGSSFTIKVAGKARSSDIQIEDTLESDHVHFDLNEATDYPVEDANGNEISGIRFRVTKITETSKGQLLRGKLYDPSRPDDTAVFDENFEYYIKCPVAVNDEFLTETGNAVDTQLIKEINGKNTFNASADGKSVEDDATIQVNLKADIAKFDGVYNADTNTMHWKVLITKMNGWWQNSVLNIDDFFVDNGYAVFDDKSDITVENGADTKRKTISNLELTVLPGTNTTDDGNGANASTTGTNAGEQDHNHVKAEDVGITYTTDGNGITITMPPGNGVDGQVWNKEPIQEFIIEYDTDVTDLDYGKTLNNWAGLERPTGGFTDQDTKPGSVPKPEIKKSSVYSEEAGTITWTITVKNPNGQELKGLKINDLLTADDGSEVSVDFSKATFSPDIKSQMEINGNTAVFKDSESFKASSYTITYVQELGEDGSKGITFSNKADLNNSDDEPISTAEDEFHVPDEYEVEKDSAFTSDGKLEYGITLKNTYGEDLNGTTFTDTITFDAYDWVNDRPADKYTVTIPGATKVDSSDEFAISGQNRGLLYCETVSDNMITLTFFIDDENEKSKTYEVNYTVEPKEGDFRYKPNITVNNTVDWNNKKASTKDTSGKFTSLSEKTGEYDSLRNLMTWKFTVYNKYEMDLGKFTGDDGKVKAVTDTMFREAKSLKITDADGKDVTKNGDLESINDDGSYTFSEGMTSKSYTFEYTTMPETSGGYHNTAEYNNDSKSAYPSVNKRSKIEKNIAKSSAVSDMGTAEVRWNVDIETYEGGLFEHPITDTMSAESSFASEEVDSSGVEHYMTAEQFDISEFKISYYTSSESNLSADLNYGEQIEHPENYFELVKTSGTDDKVTGFTVKVKDDLDPDSDEYELLGTIIRLRLGYSTTESGINALKDVNAKLGDKLTYKNSSSFDGNTAEKPDSREKNPKITKYDVTNGNYNTNENSPKTYRLEDLTIRDGAYILSYKLEVNYNKNFGTSDDITVTDTLPIGTELENLTYSFDEQGIWNQNFSEVASYDFGTDNGCAVVKTAATSEEGQIVTMYVPAKNHKGGKVTIQYTVKLPEDKIDLLKDENNRITLNNHAETDGDFDMQPIVINAGENAISKQLISGADGKSHTLEYQLDINPGRKKLSPDDSGYLMVEDMINSTDGYSAVAPFKFDEINANSVKVYVVNGDPETETPINFDEYENTFAFYEPQKTTLPVYNPTTTGDVYKLKFKIPDETHIRIKYTYTYDLYVKIDGLEINVKNKAVITGTEHNDKSDEKYKYSKAMDDMAQAYTFDHYSLIKVSKENYLDTLEGAEFTLMRYSIDGGWEYLTGYENKSAFVKIGNGYHELLSIPIGQWKKAGTGDGEASNGMVFTTTENGMISFPNLQKETTSDGKILLDYDLEGNKPKYIYKLKELKTPSGFYFADGDGSYYFYETKEGVFTASPDSVIEDARVHGGVPASAEVHAREVGTTIQLANDKMKFSVQKNWIDKSADTRPDDITVELWQSDVPPSSSETLSVTLNIEIRDWGPTLYKTIQRTLSVKNGEQLKFYLKNSNGNVDLPNGVNQTDYNNREYCTSEPVTENKTFNITIKNADASTDCKVEYYSAPDVNSDPLFDKVTGNAVLVDTAVLNAQNGWYAEFGRNGLDSSKYYYIIETDELEFYNKSYVVTGLQNSGTFELENVEDAVPKGTVTVNKTWLNDNESDVTSLQFEVVGFSEQLTQPESDYIAAIAAAGAGADTDDTEYAKAEVNMPDDAKIVVPSKSFTVTKDNATGKWSGTSPLLPLTANGEPVYYYVREADGTDYIPINYSSNGFTLNENEPKEVTVVNQKTVSKGFELPETGGSGSECYFIIGAVLMTCAGTLYIIKRRRSIPL